ncbi:MAG: HEAT repeat domain-containing protein [Candidatus Riflebacteria bacterium]|nr:HEAT repeat domain-containing protein [Candidatus Riflebacteria bacterium]
MGWFTRKITDPIEAFARLKSPDKKVSQMASEEFKSSLNNNLVLFLVEKFEENKVTEVRLKILEIFAEASEALGVEDFREILKLLAYPDNLLREGFKDILRHITEERLRPVADMLCNTNDPGIRTVLQFAVEHSGIIDQLLKKWGEYSTKEKLMHMEEIILLQNPRLYPIFFDILKEEVLDSKREEKKIIQMEFARHIEKVRDPAFTDQALKNLPNIDPTLWHPVFKCMQTQGEAFFKKLLDNLERKSEGFRLKILQLVEELSDSNSYPLLFPHLLDRAKVIPPIVQNTITAIVKRFSDELEALSPEVRKSPAILDRIAFFVKPLENCLTDNYFQVSMLICECLLRIGRFNQTTILRNFPKILKYQEHYLFSYLKGLEVADRKDLLINACCYPAVETGHAAITFLSNPSENFIIETLNSLLLEYFMRVPQAIQEEIIALMMNPQLKRFVEEVLLHNDPQVRSRILQILGETGSINVLQILIGKMRDPDSSVRITILNLLKLQHFQNDSGTEALIEFLKDTDQNVVLSAINILRDRDHPKIIGNLTKLVANREKKVKDMAHAAIAFITRRKFMTSFEQMNAETRLAIGQSLIKMDPLFLEDMTRDLSAADQKIRILAAKILEVLCDHIPPDVKTNLIVAIQDPDPHVRAIVIMCLGKIGGPSVANMLVQFLKDQDDRVRANAVESLAGVGDLSHANAITPLLHDENNRVRGNTLITLWRIGYYQINDAVIEMLRHADKWMRASGAFALGEIRDQRFIPVLVQCLRDPDADVRTNVVKSLGRLADPLMIAPYIRSLRFDPDEAVRKIVMDILSSAGKGKTEA